MDKLLAATMDDAAFALASDSLLQWDLDQVGDQRGMRPNRRTHMHSHEHEHERAVLPGCPAHG